MSTSALAVEGTELLERDDELSQLGAALASAVAGRGSAIHLEGPAGIGKTGLLAAAREQAAERGMAVLATRGGELERESRTGSSATCWGGGWSRNANSAETATNATNAANASNAQELQGRTLAEVRPIAAGIKDETTQGLDASEPEIVMSVPIAIPTGGADVVINAGMELDNETGSQAGGSCRLRFSGSVASSTVNLTMVDGHNYSLPLTAFVDSAGAGVRLAQVECQGSISDDGVDFINGDLSVVAYPIGA